MWENWKELHDISIADNIIKATKITNFITSTESQLMVGCGLLLLFAGFLEGVRPRCESDVSIKEITLLHPIAQACRGAAYLAAQAANLPINVDYSKNSKIFFHHKFA